MSDGRRLSLVMHEVLPLERDLVRFIALDRIRAGNYPRERDQHGDGPAEFHLSLTVSGSVARNQETYAIRGMDGGGGAGTGSGFGVVGYFAEVPHALWSYIEAPESAAAFADMARFLNRHLETP